ncbi:glycosyltransferase family 18 protein, partial [Tulasnella calospora MUT 4182]
YLGYSVEPSCMDTPYVPLGERPLQAYVFGKYLGYFMLKDYILWDEKGGMEGSMYDDFYLDFSQKENVTFLAGQFNLHGQPGNYTEPPRGIIQHERLPRTEFQKIIANSRVMFGLGNPLLSPTPYEALCLGIPFINPVRRWDKTDLNNKMAWTGQHDALIYEGLDEPYVYHVELGDREGFRAALRKAMSTPIERYIPPHMTSSAFLGRMKTLLETDWRPVAKTQMQVVGYKYQT